MLQKLLLALAGLVALLLVVIVLQPSDFRFERSTTIAAPATVVFPYVNDFSRFTEWSPFMSTEPDLERTVSSVSSGVGATYAWRSERAGEGHMAILTSLPHAYVRVASTTVLPTPTSNLTEYTLTPAPGGVTLTWVMSGKHGFLGKAVTLVGFADKVIGRDFERGLATLKGLAEAEVASGSRDAQAR